MMNLPSISKEKTLIGISILLLLPALLINLGLNTVYEDEAMRALVAMEMKSSGNYFVPTLDGEPYYRKTGVYNWILLFFAWVIGNFGHWTIRLPTVIFLVSYGYIVYYFCSRYFTKKQSILLGLMLITCGRFLFWDSMIGLIDTLYCLVVFSQIMVIYKYGSRDQYWKMMLFSYLLCGFGLLLKGLPSIVFQGLTLLTWAIYEKKFKILFHWSHFIGFTLFIVLIGSYYSQFHVWGGDLDKLWQVTFFESSKRLGSDITLFDRLTHFFLYPTELIGGHFMPWSFLLFIFPFSKPSKPDDQFRFINFCGWAAVVNIIPYLLSPEVLPRHVLMFPPLLFIFGYYHFLKADTKKTVTWFSQLSMSLFFLLGVGQAYLFYDKSLNVSWILPVVFGLGFIGLGFLAIRNKKFIFWVMIIGLLVARVEYNFIGPPAKKKELHRSQVQTDMEEAAKKYGENKLIVTGRADTYHDHSFYTNSYYWSLTTSDVLTRKDPQEWLDGEFYMIDRFVYPAYNRDFNIVDSVAVMKDKSWIPLGFYSPAPASLK